jgi:hypothetical protein
VAVIGSPLIGGVLVERLGMFFLKRAHAALFTNVDPKSRLAMVFLDQCSHGGGQLVSRGPAIPFGS